MQQVDKTPKAAAAVWWAYTWRFAVVGLPAAIVIGLVVTLIAPALRISPIVQPYVAGLFGFLAQIPIGIVVMGVVLRHRFSNFEIVLQKTDNVYR